MTITLQTARLQDVYLVDRPTAPVDAMAAQAVAATSAGVGGDAPGDGQDGAGAWADGSVAETYKEAQRLAALRAMALKQAAAGTGEVAAPAVPIAVAPAAAIAPLTMPTAAEIAEAKEAERERSPHHAAAARGGGHATEVAARFTEARVAAARKQATTPRQEPAPASEPHTARPAVSTERADAAPHAAGAPLGYLLGAHD